MLGLRFPTFKRAPVQPAHHFPRAQYAEKVVDAKILRTLLYLHFTLAGLRDPHDEAGHRGHLEQLRGVPIGDVLRRNARERGNLPALSRREAGPEV